MQKSDLQIKAANESLILIIASDPAVIRSIKSYLRPLKSYIVITRSCDEGIASARNHKPDLIILDEDLVLRDNFTSFDCLGKESITDIPVILMTARMQSRNLMNAYLHGVTDYVSKPLHSVELLARVNSHLILKHYLDQIEEKNKQLEAVNRDKNELLSITAHDLKNPIYSMSMLAKYIRDEKGLPREEIEEFSQDIVTTAQRMLELINNILDLNKIELGQIKFNPEQFDVNELALTTIDMYRDRARAKDIEIHFDTRIEDPTITTDRNITLQILDNLISNAVKYSPFGKNIFVNVTGNGKYARIEVRDQGPGINEDDMKKLFGKFARLSAKPTGDEESSGLGLSIVKKYVEMMNGRVWCESEPGLGANFIVELPNTLE